jgi:mono/diheme cytochrome c family protein
MRARSAWTILTLVVALVVLIVIAMMDSNLTALDEPGRFETVVSNWATHFFIRRASRQRIPPRPVDTKASVANGSTRFDAECAICHGSDGHGQTPVGRWMYPRAADLTSQRAQDYSDQELFWIVQNGIRFTGMPAFGKIETGDRIWDLVNYVRTLHGALRKKSRLRGVRFEQQMSEVTRGGVTCGETNG